MNGKKVLGVVLGVAVVIGFVIFMTVTPAGRKFLKKWDYDLKKVDEKSYTSQKAVEDTSRAYLSSYQVDQATSLAYTDYEHKYELALAKSARVRAIATGTYYNEYFSKNSFIWKDNKPSDLPDKLDISIE